MAAENHFRIRPVVNRLLMLAWKMTRPVNLFALNSGLPLVGLGSFAVRTSIGCLLASPAAYYSHPPAGGGTYPEPASLGRRTSGMFA